MKKVTAFYTVWMPGNIRVGTDGEPLPGNGPKMIYTIYAETSSPTIAWDTALVSGTKYKILSTQLKEKTIDAGLDKNSQQPITIKLQNGGYLWRLQLEVKENMTNPILTDKPLIIHLSGIDKGKKFDFIVENSVELYTPPSY